MLLLSFSRKIQGYPASLVEVSEAMLWVYFPYVCLLFRSFPYFSLFFIIFLCTGQDGADGQDGRDSTDGTGRAGRTKNRNNTVLRVFLLVCPSCSQLFLIVPDFIRSPGSKTKENQRKPTRNRETEAKS